MCVLQRVTLGVYAPSWFCRTKSSAVTRCRATATRRRSWRGPPRPPRTGRRRWRRASGYRRSVSAAPPQYTSRMERSTKMRRVTVPDSPWTVPAGEETRGACSFSDCSLQVAAPGGGGVGVDLLRAEQAVDADAVRCRLVPDADTAAVARQPHRGAEPVGAGAAQVDSQLQFQCIAGHLFPSNPGRRGRWPGPAGGGPARAGFRVPAPGY